jgi:ubiquinone/menaquinone biosynthesis C-methylase UbiE
MPGNTFLNFARWYDPLFEGVLGGLRALAARVVPPEEGMKVLDVGCGTGAQLAIYQKGGCQVFGTDLSPPMLRIASANLGNQAALNIGDALRMPYPDGFFDLVISSLFLHQIKSGLRTAVLEEAARVLNPEGNLMLIDFHAQEKRSVSGNLTHVFISMIEFFAGWEHFSNSRDFLAKGGIPPLAKNIGMQNRKSIVVGSGNLGVYLLRRV